jgi:hypothetical protein
MLLSLTSLMRRVCIKCFSPHCLSVRPLRWNSWSSLHFSHTRYACSMAWQSLIDPVAQRNLCLSYTRVCLRRFQFSFSFDLLFDGCVGITAYWAHLGNTNTGALQGIIITMIADSLYKHFRDKTYQYILLRLVILYFAPVNLSCQFSKRSQKKICSTKHRHSKTCSAKQIH